MKKSILTLAIAVAFPLATTSTLTLADYRMHIGMETPQGGSLPKGSITFGNGGVVTPPIEPIEPTEPSIPDPIEPSVPEVVDPFAPENPACDPLAQGYPGNVTGKELVWSDGFYFADGTMYRSCKLKDAGEPNLLARYVAGISEPSLDSSGNVRDWDKCNPNSPITQVNSIKCEMHMTFFSMPFTPTSNGAGGYSYSNLPFQFFLPAKAGFTYDDIGNIEIDGHACTNLRSYVVRTWPTLVMSTERICDFSGSYETLKAKVGQPYIVKIYRK